MEGGLRKVTTATEDRRSEHLDNEEAAGGVCDLKKLRIMEGGLRKVTTATEDGSSDSDDLDNEEAVGDVCDLEDLLKIGSKVRKRNFPEWCEEVRYGGSDPVDRQWEDWVGSSSDLWEKMNEEEQRKDLERRWTYLKDLLNREGIDTSNHRPLLSMRIIEHGDRKSEEGIVEFKIGSPDKGLVSINNLVLDRGSYSRWTLPRQSVNGLLCLRTSRNDAFLIYNPITGEKSPWIEIKNKQARNQISFGFDKQTNEHKVICISSSSKSGSGNNQINEVVEVFTVGKNTWRRIDAIPPIALDAGYDEKDPYYVDGCIYRRIRPDVFHPWVRERILRFDIATEKFRIIPIPDFVVDPERYKFSQTVELTELDGCIAVLIWMRELKIILWKFREVSDGNMEWIEEVIDIPPHWNGKPDISIEALTGTRQIFLHYEDSDSIFYYNRNTKESLRFPIWPDRAVYEWERFIQV
ncbi:hypothetical protein MKX03_007844 [Papaver bracteatum]|nr:hypothetical protein MKX03_007844 [Papaver bracteatum]